MDTLKICTSPKHFLASVDNLLLKYYPVENFYLRTAAVIIKNCPVAYPRTLIYDLLIVIIPFSKSHSVLFVFTLLYMYIVMIKIVT